ncbi:MAG: hypothetical protein IMZ61_15535 [Planctomycetes bacterium]|nr:hypothetical protein [Planctomycetota bacterium]
MTKAQKTIVMVAAVLSFLAGLLTLGITMTLVLAAAVMLLTMKKGGGGVGITRAQMIIVMTAVILILMAGLFPPYWEAKIDEEGRLYGKYTKWEFNQNLRDLIESVIEKRSPEMISYMRRDSLLLIEFFGILALAGGALLIIKKDNRKKL